MSGKQVLLGIRDLEIVNGEGTTWMANKIGGQPDWMPNCSSLPCLKCKLCNQKMSLVVQLYCPLGNSVYHRTLYVFCCTNQLCWNKQESWQVYRTQYLIREEKQEERLIENHREEWLSDELDWEDKSQTLNDNKVLADILCITDEVANLKTEDNIINESKLDWDGSKITTSASLVNEMRDSKQKSPYVTSNSSLPECFSFKSYFINVIDEPDVIEVDSDSHVQRLLNSYHMHEGSEIESAQDSEFSGCQFETYEKDWVKHGDELFHKFAKRVARQQDQIIRYCWGDEPLLISRMDRMLPVLCQQCKGPVVFELQLMPALVEMLKFSNFQGTPVEFGTVIVKTCQQSCWKNEMSYCAEFVCLQSDPDESLYCRE